MVSLKVLASLALASLANASAPVVSDSPTNVVYQATFNNTVEGYVKFSSTNGTVLVDVKLSGLPKTGGPFLYHIHEKPVPASGNCSATLDHLNPYGGSSNATDPANKEVGDLSGKHGLLKGTSPETTYVDDYLSLDPKNKAFFGDLSVVVHFKNTTRLACANITQVRSVPVADDASRLFSGAALPVAAGMAAMLL